MYLLLLPFFYLCCSARLFALYQTLYLVSTLLHGWYICLLRLSSVGPALTNSLENLCECPGRNTEPAITTTGSKPAHPVVRIICPWPSLRLFPKQYTEIRKAGEWGRNRIVLMNKYKWQWDWGGEERGTTVRKPKTGLIKHETGCLKETKLDKVCCGEWDRSLVYGWLHPWASEETKYRLVWQEK